MTMASKIPCHYALDCRPVILIITALPIEYQTLCLVLGPVLEPSEPDHMGHGSGIDEPRENCNTYRVGYMQGKYVALVHLPEAGQNAAARAMERAKMDFKEVKQIFLVGICGALPYHRYWPEQAPLLRVVETDAGSDKVELCDVYISTLGVQDYGCGKQLEDRFILTRPLVVPEGEVADSIRTWLSDRPSGNAAMSDRACLEAQANQIYSGFYDKPEMGGVFFPKSMEGGRPFRIRDGRFASANVVMKSSQDAARVAETHGVHAFEMEGSGLTPLMGVNVLLIKGVSDFADCHKNDDQQACAALASVAVLCAVLARFPAVPSLSWVQRLSGSLDKTRNTEPRTMTAEPRSVTWINREEPGRKMAYRHKGKILFGRCYRCGNRSHWLNQCFANIATVKKERERRLETEDECCNCGVRGHFESDCYLPDLLYWKKGYSARSTPY